MLELLSPAGNIESLKSAVYNMADAVYLGLEHFNARMKADNFSTQNIKQWVEFCHLYSVKIYVTLNTLIKDSEFDTLKECLIACENAGVDALIITDLALVGMCRKYSPSIPLHASTQLGIHNYLGAKFAERLGFSRIVLSREATIDDIKSIKEHTSLEIEYFVHGAMCVSFSGGCLFSSIASGNSGNRGLCLQPCRKLYTNNLTNEKAYYLSPKDQCLINNLDALIKAGVDSFKIEGRLKSAEYVASVVKAYRNMLDNHKCTQVDLVNMKKTFNRGNFSQGYAFSQKNEIMYKHNQSNIGIQIGKIIDCRINKKGYYDIVIKSNHNFANGDGCKIIKDNIELGGFVVNIIKSDGNIFTLYTKDSYPINSIVHLTYDVELSKQLKSNIRQINLNLKIVLSKNSLEIKTKINTFKGLQTINYKVNLNLENSINKPLSESEFINQFSKSGDTPFKLYIYAQLSENLFIPKSVINQLRRDYLEWLKKEIIELNAVSIMHKNNVKSENFPTIQSAKTSKYIIEIGETLDLKLISVGSNDLVVDISKIDAFTIKNNLIQNNIFIKLPKLALFNDLNLIINKLKMLMECNWFAGIYVDNIYALEISVKYDLKIIAGFGLNFMNTASPELLGLTSYCISPEVNYQELATMNKNCIIYGYGYMPLMTLAHCPIINIYGCKCNSCKYKPFDFYDNYGKFSVTRCKLINCVFTMRNSVCHNLLQVKHLEEYNKYIDLNGIGDLLKGEIVDNINSLGYISHENNYTNGQITRGVK